MVGLARSLLNRSLVCGRFANQNPIGHNDMTRRNAPRIDQQLIFSVATLLLSSTLAHAGTYYVRADGNNANTGTANVAGGAWRTIDYAAAHVAAGDTVRVQPGTYVEVASPRVSGTLGNTVTLVADGPVTTCGMNFSGQNYIRVIGFTMDPDAIGCTPNVPIVIMKGINTGVEFWNNTFQNTNANAFLVDTSDRCNSCIIIGGAVQNIGRSTGSFNGLTLTGNDTFVGYVNFRTICYLGIVPSGQRLRMVNLDFSGMLQCNAGGAHPDFIYVHGLSPAGYSNNLVESSYGIGTVTSYDNKAMHVQNQTTTPWNDNIWRLNVTYNLGSGFYSVYSDRGAINRLRFYNNTHVNCVRGSNDQYSDSCGSFEVRNGNVISASIYNNIFYQAWADAAINNVAVWSEAASPVIAKDYNLAYSPNGVGVLFGGFYGGWPVQAHKLSQVNPSFVNTSSDFTLQSGSPARGFGGPLTTASASGSSSTSLTVASNTGSFFIGDNASNLPQYSGALVPGDVITVGATAVRVSSVSGDTLTLASPISWNNGAPVYFGSSSTIDLGAYPYKAGGYALNSSVAIVGGTATITPNDASLVRFVVCYSDGVPYAVDNSSPYTCAVPTGTFSAKAYPRYASKAPSPPTNVLIKY